MPGNTQVEAVLDIKDINLKVIVPESVLESGAQDKKRIYKQRLRNVGVPLHF